MGATPPFTIKGGMGGRLCAPLIIREGRERERRSFPYGVRKDTCFAPIKQFSTNEKRPLEQEALPAIN